MKQIRFLGILLTCFALLASTIVEARLIERTFTVKNKSVHKVRVAYCYGVSEKDIRPGQFAGYHIKGWEYVDPGHSKLFKVNTPYRNFFVYVQRADGAEYVVKRETSRFYIQPEAENFQVIQRFGDGKVLHHTGDLSSLQKVTFYKYEDRRTFTIPGPLTIQAESIERTFTVKNKSVYQVRVAYCYGVSEKDIRPGQSAGYHIKGWEYVHPGHAKLFKMNTPYRNFFVYVQRADGAEYVVKRETSRFYIQPEAENFQVIQRFGDGKVLHHTGDLSRLQKVTFYKYEDRRTLMIPGPLAIQDGTTDTSGSERHQIKRSCSPRNSFCYMKRYGASQVERFEPIVLCQVIND